ncbi:hypothetical protein [Parashewanella tropica]|uniref:hypothetical protein n=1 Tax=Parashewanella tropica TaxID=2547970 RepID=UPI001059527D|nr:hypothetical protein [Parashewanella tropica]
MKVIRGLFVLAISVFIFACNDGNHGVTSGSVKHGSSESSQSITGVVVGELLQGKDGTIWKFKADDGKIYALVVSIPNLGEEESKNISLIELNKHLVISGETYKLGNENRLIARKIKPFN